ncbi:MAG: ABC transporter substrate-binding protein [Solirubrobacterales bacterium]
MRLTRAITVAVLAGAIVLGVTACGSDSDEGSGSLTRATLVLDYLPNGVHAGIYAAIDDGYYEDEGIDLKVITPTSTADTLRLIQSGKADFGLADGIDIATQIDAGRQAKGILAITQRPSGGLITLVSGNISSPDDLEGRVVGVTGVPSDEAVFETIVEDAGGDPSESRVVSIGFNGIQALRARRVSAFTGYIPADATAISSAGPATRSFAFDRFGGPSYPGLVAFSTESRIKEDPDLMEGFARATSRGYASALDEPEAAVEDLVKADQAIDPELALATFRAYVPLIGPVAGFGRFNPIRLTDLSDFLVERKLVEEPIAPNRFGTNEFVDND